MITMQLFCQKWLIDLEPIIIILMRREKLLNILAQIILHLEPDHPVRVAIDGVDASGKTTLANELAEVMQNSDRQIIRASVDNFHNPKRIRRKQGNLSPEGFYHDSYNYDALEEVLLKPLGPCGDRHYQTAVFDLQQDQPIESPSKIAEQDAVLLMDGIFLLRPRLMSYWDLTLYINVDYAHTMARGVHRDAEIYGSADNAALRYLERYIPGQQLYHKHADPLDKADILIDNNDLGSPKFIRVPDHLWPETITLEISYKRSVR